MTVIVRRATRDDAEVVADYAMRLVEQHQAYDPLRFARIANLDGMKWFYGGQTEANEAVVLVAELEGRVVGFAYVTYEAKNFAELAVSAAHLHDIYVDSEARRTGAGQKLIAAAVEAAKGFGASKLMLSVAAKNPVAKSFFEQTGFETTMHEMMLAVSD